MIKCWNLKSLKWKLNMKLLGIIQKKCRFNSSKLPLFQSFYIEEQQLKWTLLCVLVFVCVHWTYTLKSVLFIFSRSTEKGKKDRLLNIDLLFFRVDDSERYMYTTCISIFVGITTLLLFLFLYNVDYSFDYSLYIPNSQLPGIMWW